MDKIKEVKFELEGLTCADCANKIEGELSKQANIKRARVDMVLGKAILEVTDDVELDDEFVKQVEETVHVIENIPVYLEGEKDEVHHDHKLSPFIPFGLLLIVLSFFLEKGPILNSLIVINYFVVAYPILKNFVKGLKNGQFFDENVLMSVATLGALAIGEYAEALGVMVFYSIGEYFQHKAVDDSRASIQALLEKKPEFARVIRNNQEQIVACEDVNVGEQIRILPSDQVPLDGRIVEGQSSLDMSSLTGESIPVNVKVDDQIMSGSLNLSSPIIVEVEKEYSDSTISKLLYLIENSSRNKAKTELFMTKFSKVYTPIVFVLSILIFVFVMLRGAVFQEALYRALVFLVISCPCALVLSIPLAYFAGIGQASRDGILIKGGESIENLSSVDAVVFDKTGTLTKGEMEVIQYTHEEVLEIAAHLESFSNHPIAKAIVSTYSHPINQNLVSDLSENFGKGISARYKGDKVFVGSLDEAVKINLEAMKFVSDHTTVVVLRNQEVLGALYLEDELREDSLSLVRELHGRGIKTYILSGDRQEAVDLKAKEMGIDFAIGNLLPEDKVSKFQNIQNEYEKSVVYVGDGMNDAAVLASSDVGISMGTVGNDLAVEYSDLVLVDDEPLKIIRAMDLSKKTQSITISNIVFILAVKIFVLLLGGLGIAKMWEAVIADVGVSLLAVLNSMRIMRK